MKLLRFGPAGHERPAGLDPAGVLRDLSPVVPDIDGHLLAQPDALAAVRGALAGGRLPLVPAGERLGPPVARPGKVVGIGLNYRDHAAEIGAEVPSSPVVFLKSSSSISGPNDDIELPPGSVTTDHEVELGVVVGTTLRHCADHTTALSAVGGYLAANDLTERTLAAEGPTWAKGKCHDTFCPIGPWLVTPDEVDDPQDLDLRLWVDGDLRQRSNTGEMAFGVGELLSYLSGLMALEPGDLVITGTPGGIAVGQPEPRPYLREGAVVEVEVQGLGRQRNPVRGSRLWAGRAS